MNWGNWIVVAFVLFGVFIATLVVVCARQDISLVTKDYYKEELVYQDQIERINNTTRLELKPVISVVQEKYLQVDFYKPVQIESGVINLFCPSNAEQDRKFELRVTGGSRQLFDLDEVKKGMYRAKMMWKMNGKEFYVEEIIYI